MSLPIVTSLEATPCHSLPRAIPSHIRYEDSLPGELKRHLNTCDERILESLAWEVGSSVYHTIVNGRPDLVPEVKRLQLLPGWKGWEVEEEREEQGEQKELGKIGGAEAGKVGGDAEGGREEQRETETEGEKMDEVKTDAATEDSKADAGEEREKGNSKQSKRPANPAAAAVFNQFSQKVSSASNRIYSSSSYSS